MNAQTLSEIIDRGYADEAGIAADVIDAITGKAYVLCVNGEVVTLAAADTLDKVFSDSIDRLDHLEIKSGLFKKTVSFDHGGARYALSVKGGKNVFDYFKLLAADN